MKGIDVSAWQNNIDWQSVKNAGIEFVIVKLGQSNSLDEMFVSHINNAVEAGLKIGIYYYAKATSTDEAKQEAEWVDDQIKQLLNGQCPEMGIWYDVEDPCIVGSDITALCKAFIDPLIEYNNVGIYSSYDWLTNGNIDTVNLDVSYWCAQYNSECDFQHPKLKIWQYTDSLNIGGTNFDGNTYM